MRKKITIGICSILCVTAIAVVGILAYPSLFKNILGSSSEVSQKADQPDELLLQYFSGIGSGQYEDLYEMLDERSQAEISKDDFVSRNKNIYGGIEAENLSVSITEMYDSEAKPDGFSDASVDSWKVVEYAMRMDTVAGEITYTNYAVFSLNEEEAYRMEWSPQSIFPSLTWDDKVRVNTLAAERGGIYDRNGEMLAGAGVASAIGFVPGKMQKTEEGTPQDSEDIARVAGLLEMTSENIMKKLNASYVKDDTFVSLKTVSKEAYELKDELLTIPGIMICDTPVRHYPLGEKASHLVGYIQGINAEELESLKEQGYTANGVLGKAGLEKIYEEQLRAIDGCEVVVVDNKGDLKETLAKKDKVDGKDITLTIDAQIQSQLYDLFCQDKSCSVAMNPKTGEVLALVSTPSYDANDFVLGMSTDKWNTMNEDENKPMYNRFKAAICPGSTMKALTAAIGMNTGSVSPDDDFGHSGLTWKKDESWGGYYITTTKEYDEPANLENALVYSDNIFFAKAAIKIGADTFAKQLLDLGFEERIPFEYGLYSSIISTTETFTSEIQLADSGFGQGEVLVNPVHLAVIYAAFVNDGNIVQPRLIYSGDSAPILWKEHAFSSETAKTIRDDLIQVIERGTGTEAKISGKTLAGKTGTAEIKQSKEDQIGTELGWFTLFTADESSSNPFLVISMVEDVKDRGGSHYVIPKVKMLFE